MLAEAAPIPGYINIREKRGIWINDGMIKYIDRRTQLDQYRYRWIDREKTDNKEYASRVF
jgi:hypothetical protein